MVLEASRKSAALQVTQTITVPNDQKFLRRRGREIDRQWFLPVSSLPSHSSSILTCRMTYTHIFPTDLRQLVFHNASESSTSVTYLDSEMDSSDIITDNGSDNGDPTPPVPVTPQSKKRAAKHGENGITSDESPTKKTKTAKAPAVPTTNKERKEPAVIVRRPKDTLHCACRVSLLSTVNNQVCSDQVGEFLGHLKKLQKPTKCSCR